MWFQKTHRPSNGGLRRRTSQKRPTIAFTVVLMLTVILLPPVQADYGELSVIGEGLTEYELLPNAGGHGWEMLDFSCSGSYTTDTSTDLTSHAEHKKTWTGNRVEVETSTDVETQINYFFSCSGVWEAEGYGFGGHSRRVTLRVPTGSTDTTNDKDLAGEYGEDSVAYSEYSSGCIYWGFPIGQPSCSQRFEETFYDERYVEGTSAMPMQACLEVDLATITVVNRHHDSTGQEAPRFGLSIPLTPYPYEATYTIQGVEGDYCNDILWTEIGGSGDVLDPGIGGINQRF